MAECDTSFDSYERPCVAIEWSDGGIVQSSDTIKSCALAWGCDYTEYWSGGSVFKKITGIEPATCLLKFKRFSTFLRFFVVFSEMIKFQ